MKTKILLAGGSGLIGQRLTEFLNPEKYEFNILSRRKRNNRENCQYFLWDTDSQNIDEDALRDVSVVINLAGAGIADKRWTPQRKKELVDSRVNSILTLQKYLDDFQTPPIYIGASAVGYYGDNGEKKMTETESFGDGFLADVTKVWEEAHFALEEKVSRICLLRIGIVLSKKGGALKEMLKPTLAGMYGYFGSGSAYYSWIHIDDVCEIIRQSLNDERYEGVVNTTAPEPITIKALAKALKEGSAGIGLVVPVPNFALKIALGEMSQMLTNSTRVIPQKLLSLKHSFLYTDAEKAIKDILERKI